MLPFCPPNPRSYALSPALLKLLGIDPQTTATKNERTKGFYHSMQVWENNQPASLLWSVKDLPQDAAGGQEEESSSLSYLGCSIEDAVLTEHLWEELARTKNVSVFSRSQLKNIDWPLDAIDTISTHRGGWVQGSLFTAAPEEQDNTPLPSLHQSIWSHLNLATVPAGSECPKHSNTNRYIRYFTSTTFTYED